ncbi:PD40 domain-containing protein [Pseudenhygromyxa sp. WMMC2535]|uniref:TolB family protein n=1 Tax=Pseudenhygromyxa sp. WMMC2535 TaxID=2712867 RepID=UPI001551BB4A|nr:PD40 domain-containing protein [Pseudenhygromyxa sp. WMMC2535]NVB39392.1 PD40 domain-containing protein [Pseudenhygromyxa sp. WMMC2535]
MSMHRSLLTLSLIPALTLAACAGDEGRPSDDNGDGVGLDEAGDGSDDGLDAGDGADSGLILDMPDEPAFIDLQIDPPAVVIEVVDGVIPEQIDFSAIVTNNLDEEYQVDGNGVWSWDRLDIAELDPGPGALTATGLLGGKGTLSFTYEGLEATADVTVKLSYTIDEIGDPLALGMLDAASTADPSLSLLYPYNNTVFPRGLLGPTVQWNGGNDADVYKIHAESSTFELDWYGTAANPSRWDFPALPEDMWLKLTDSTEGDITFEIRRYDGVTAYTTPVQFWTIAPANLAGTIYYWAVNQGDVLRIKPGEAAPEQFLQKPAGAGCLACHSVSTDGSTIVTAQDMSGYPWAAFDPEGTNTFDAAGGAGYSAFQAVSPDGAYVLWGQSNGSFYAQPNSWMALSTKDSVGVLAQLFVETGYPVHPAWSHDGTKVAYGVRTDGNWLDFVNATLWVADVDLNQPAFSNHKQIVANDATRPTVSYPTWSPDSEWLAFGRSTQARTRGANGELWMVRADGSEPVRIDNANGFGHIADAQTAANYEPTFVPVASGGYYWLVFVSERQYGNTLTDQAVATRTKQLWVTAIDPNAAAGTDPSHPAFWLPGQELGNNNMRGYAALDACREIGQDCEAGYDCCSGYCVEAEPGVFACDDEVPMCSPMGSVCETSADCCDEDADCIGGYCSQLIG